jgi:hypothetical protein
MVGVGMARVAELGMVERKTKKGMKATQKENKIILYLFKRRKWQTGNRTNSTDNMNWVFSFA